MDGNSKKEICINFLHPILYRIDNKEEKLNKAIELLAINKMPYKFVWGEDACDYLFISESIYYGEQNKETRKKFKEIIKKSNPILIFHARECIEPDFNVFDYAVGFDRNLSYDDRFCRMPFKLRFYETYVKDINNVDTIESAKEELKKKKYFCNFMYSNGSAHHKRDELFYDVSKYKKVYSIGKHLKNFEISKNEIKKYNNWILDSIEMKSKFKFSIASENACYPGYTSEKIFTSMQAHTIPIYWGDPIVKQEFNEEAFINVNDFKSENDLIDYIEKIDKDDKLWCEMISKPWKTNKQMEKEKNEINEYYKFFMNIFNQDLNNAKRVAEGCHPERYRRAFYMWKANKSLIRQYLGKLKYILKERIVKIRR